MAVFPRVTTVAPSAAKISHALGERMERLGRDLFPAARRAGNLLRVGGTDGERGQSLAIQLTGPRAGKWCDYATGEHGDALDLIRAVRRCDLREALAWARGWLGVDERSEPRPPPPRRPAAPAPDQPAEDDFRRRAAMRIWLAAQPSLIGTAADSYLRARGLDLSELGRQPRALRYSPALWCRETDAFFPALVGAVSGAGGFCGVHRTYLAETPAGTWAKAPITNPKLSLGAIAGGVIPLQRGASGKPLREAPAGETAVIGEGIETSMSIAVGCPELRVLCGVSLGNLLAVDLPPAIATVILAADNDPSPGAQKLLRRAARRFIEQGRLVRIARSPAGKDFNDLVCEGLEV